jgi:hypothetical protein
MLTLGEGWLTCAQRTRAVTAILLYLLVTLATTTAGVDGKQSYSVVAPKVIRPNSNFFVAVSVDGTEGDLQVALGLSMYCMYTA